MKIDFAIKEAELAVAEGLPPLRRMEVSGTVTGTTANVRSPTARVEMPDGRALAFTAGAFAVANIWSADALGASPSGSTAVPMRSAPSCKAP
jgi:hypothetical protein